MQRNAKAAAKRARRESRRQENGSLDSMMARVDEFGHIIEIEDAGTDAAGDDADRDEDSTSGA